VNPYTQAELVEGLAADSAEELLAALLARGFGRGAAGVTTLYAYATGKLRSRLGDLEVFRRAFGNELYAPLMQAADVHAEQPIKIGGSARAELRVQDAGQGATYQLGMVQERSGSHSGKWRLSGVFREGVDL